MKAAIIREFGDPSVLTIAEVDTPTPRPGHVLVKILAAGVNRFDHYIREGSVVPDLPFPHILGADAAGEIAEIGLGVDMLRVGDRVVPMTGYPDNAGDADIHPNSAELRRLRPVQARELRPVSGGPRTMGRQRRDGPAT